ncbi:hypothetical protein IWW39_005696, partial [Coemansia spiralis]
MLDRNASVASRATAASNSSSHSEAGAYTGTVSVQRQQRQGSLSIDQISVDSAQATLTPTSRGSYDTPNDNENDGLYASEFWLTALVPKPHTNFFGYESSIGPICISISTRESHECYKALVRTPFKFGVVYVPTMVIDEPIFGTDLDRLSSPTPQKILLYHALRLYFQQADDERRGYLLTALRNRQLAQSAANGVRFAKPAATCVPDVLWGRTVADAIKDVSVTPGSVSGSAECPPPRRKRGLQRSNTKRSIELRRAEINDFIDSIFQPNPDPAPKQSPLALRPASFDGDCDDGFTEECEESAMLGEIHSFLAAERELRDLAVATESLTEIRDDHLKPLLRNLEPKLFRRRLRVDFVVVGATDHSQLVDNTAPHRRFLRTLERASARMRGDSGSAADSLRPGEDMSPEQLRGSAKGSMAQPSDKAMKQQQALAAAAVSAGRRQKTREELEVKRNNVIQELISTERSYVEKMRALIDIYAVPLRSAARSANNALIPAYDAHVVFGNIERVSEVNERFLGDLEAWHRGEMDPKETIGSLCRDHFVDFHVYKRYINGYQHALVMSRELEAKNPLYAAFLQRAREREECRKLGISDLLIMPVQRIPRYTLLLSDLIKLIPEDDPDVPRIRLALERVNEIGQLADNQVAESVAELHHIHTTIEGCPPNLISASREFIGAIDASEIDLATGAPKKPMCLLVFSDLLMIVERFWPPRDHGGIRVTGKATSRQQCPLHAMSPSEATKAAAAGLSSSSIGATSMGSGASPMAPSPAPASALLSAGPLAKQPAVCTCGSGYGSSSPAANAFLSTSTGGSNRKRWGRFAGWIDITRVSILEKNMSLSSRSFFIHRYPGGADDPQASAADVSSARRQRTATTTPSANPKSLKSSGSSIISLDSSNTSSPLPAGDPHAQLHATSGRLASDQVHQEFARILYPNETTYESYGDHGYWYPQSLHEFDTDHPLSRDAFFEFLNTAWERSVARCFETPSSTSSTSSSVGLSRNGSNSGSGTSAFAPRTRADTGGGNSNSAHRRTKSGVEDFAPATSLVHPELDRVDVGGQSWTVRIWDSADYSQSRHNCPSALAADMTVVWDYRQVGSPSQLIALDDRRRGRDEQPLFKPTQAAFYPLQACRVMDFGDDYYHVTSTVLPLDAQNPSAASDTFAELVEEREVADSWPALCRLVEQAITMYQYVLLAYPEHRRVQQCYNRSILASLFGQNALGSSASAKTEAASATPRKLFSRAKHLFSSGKQRGSSSFKESPDASNLFSSAYSNAVAVDTIGPSSGSSPYNHSTISTPLSVLGKYKLKTKSSTMVSSRRVHAVQQQSSSTSSPVKAASAVSSPAQSLGPHTGANSDKAALTPVPFNVSDEFLFSSCDIASRESSASAANSRKRFDASSAPRAGSTLPSGRKVSHTIDDFPSLAPGSGSEQVELRIRSQTSWEHRGRSVSSMMSVKSSSPGQVPRAVVSPSPNGPANFVSPSLCGSSSMLSVLDDRAPNTRLAEGDAYVKRRSMSVVSASSARTGQDLFSQRLRPAASSASSRGGEWRGQGDDDEDSEYSLRLDLQPHSDGLDIPSDLRLEFDEALGGASSTPPHPSAGLAILDMQAFSSPFAAPVASSQAAGHADNAGLNVLIPSAGNSLDPRNTWDARSPDHDDSANQRGLLPLYSADSTASVLTAQSTSSKASATSRGPNRRQAVYGAPLHSPTVATENAAGPARETVKPHLALSESNILLDIARELGQDEPFGTLAANSPIYVDDDEIASHLGQMSMLRRSQTSPMFQQFDDVSSSTPDSGASTLTSRDSLRPLPPLPPHTKSLNLGSGSDRQKAPAPLTSSSKAAVGSSIYASAWAQVNRPRAPQPPPM